MAIMILFQSKDQSSILCRRTKKGYTMKQPYKSERAFHNAEMEYIRFLQQQKEKLLTAKQIQKLKKKVNFMV